MDLNFSKIKILLIGDFMLDHYIMGSSNRLSPEAPVPVIIPEKSFSIPGGAGNVAMNLAELGANINCVGLVGDDKWGKLLIKIMEDKNIDTSGIEIAKNFPTTIKKRIYSNGKQIARLDKEKKIKWKINDNIFEDTGSYDIVILSDYNKGVLSSPQSVIKNIQSKDAIKKIDIIVDPKKNDFKHYQNASIITPNLKELQKSSNCDINDEMSIIDACSSLIEKHNFDYICAKKGEKGMSIVGKNGFLKNIEPHFVNNPDVTGAGDTAISALTITYALTKDIEFSAKIANAAASIAVSKAGTAMVSIEELNKLISIKTN